MAARSLSNTNASITSVGYPGRIQNTQVGSTTSTIVLDAGASDVDNNYIGAMVRQTDGAGEARIITAYDGNTRTATIYPDWGSPPDGAGGEEFTLFGHSGIAQSGTRGTITLAATDNENDDYYRECYIRITAGPGENQIAKIISYDGTTKVATFARQLEVAPELSSVYLIAGEWGTGTTTPVPNLFILSTTASNSDNFYVGCYIEFLSDDADVNSGLIYQIIEYDGAERSVLVNGNLTQAGATTYRIFGGWGGAYESVKNCSAYNLAVTASLDQYGVYEASMSDFSYGTSVIDGEYLPTRVQKFGAWGNIAQPAVQGREFFTEPILNDFVRIAIIMFGSNIQATCTPKWISAPQLSTDTISALVPTSGQTITSALNSSTTPLGDGATFTGSFEKNDLSDVMVSCQAVGNSGTLFFDFSVDGFNVITFPVAGFTVTAGIHKFHTAVKGPRFCRIRLVNDAGAAQTELRLFTYFGTFRQGNAPLNQSIAEDSDATTVKAVLAGQNPKGDYMNVGIDTQSNLNVNINSSLGAFDEIAITSLTPLDSLKFVYGINTDEIERLLSPASLVTVSQDGTAGLPVIQSIYMPEKSAFSTLVPDYFYITAGGGALSYFWFDSTGTQLDPTPPAGGTAVKVDISADTTSSEVATRLGTAVTGAVGFNLTSVFGNIVTITNAANGAVAAIDATTMPANFDASGEPVNSGSSIASARASSLLTLTCGTGVGDFAIVRGRTQIKYQPGQGIIARMSCIFSAGEANLLQFIGVGNSTNGFYFGYNGGTFGIRHQFNGIHSVRTLQITGTPTGAGNVVVTIDGVSFTIAISNNQGTTTEVASEIAATDFSTVGYVTDVVDSLVIFLSNRTTAGTGTRTFAFDAGVTGVTAIFPADSDTTPTTSVSDSTKTDIAASSFNIDKLDGTGPSGMTINPLIGNVYQIQYQWLGFGRIVFYVESTTTGRLIPVHVIYPAELGLVVPSVSQPDMQLTVFITTTSSGVSAGKTIQTASMGAFLENRLRFRRARSHTNTHVDINYDVTTPRILFAVRNPRTYRGVVSQLSAQLRNFSIACGQDTNGSRAVVIFQICIGGTVTPPSRLGTQEEPLPFTYQDSTKTNTPMYLATPSLFSNALDDPVGYELSNFRSIYEASLVDATTQSINLAKDDLFLFKNETLYVVYTVKYDSGAVDVTASLNWTEYP